MLNVSIRCLFMLPLCLCLVEGRVFPNIIPFPNIIKNHQTVLLSTPPSLPLGSKLHISLGLGVNINVNNMNTTLCYLQDLSSYINLFVAAHKKLVITHHRFYFWHWPFSLAMCKADAQLRHVLAALLPLNFRF